MRNCAVRLLLAAAVAGMALTYLAPPLIVAFGSGNARILGSPGTGGNPLRHVTPLSLSLHGWALPAITLCYMLYTLDSPCNSPAAGGSWKGASGERTMTGKPAALRSGKGHRDENFPVASRLIHPRHRGPSSPSTSSYALPTTLPITPPSRTEKLDL
jgi:hypothetical protein